MSEMEAFEEKLRRVLSEEVSLAPYDCEWPKLFLTEAEHLYSCLPNN